jgi:hypothetical protein
MAVDFINSVTHNVRYITTHPEHVL